MIKLIIFGANGMLGNYVSSYLSQFYQIIKVDRNILDVSNASVEKITKILETDFNNEQIYVINCIGIIPQRNNPNDIRKYIQVNSLFPHLLATCCVKMNFKLIHITTDCVYNGIKGKYNENDEHDETNIYGISKSLGEPTNCCVIRTSIIGEETQNKKSLLEWVLTQNNKNVNGFVNHYWNGVTCLQLSKIINYMINKKIYWNGVRHIFSPDIVNKYDLIMLIKETYNLNISINKFETDKIDKTLTSKYEPFMLIPSLNQQINEMKDFNIKNL